MRYVGDEGVRDDERAARVFGRSRMFGYLGPGYWEEGCVMNGSSGR
jgi:hypothetical protein